MYLASRAQELFPGAAFAVAHCNFSLRGAESDGDEAFVRDWCAAHGYECFVRKFDTREYARAHKISIEAAARDLRYRWFAGLCKGEKEAYGSGAPARFDAVAVAHNACDNAETLFLNLLRGTGLKGICGMSAEGIVPGSCDNGDAVTLLRPLLGTTREEINSWMVSNGVSWREDSTNSDSTFKRNAIRNRVFPILKEMNPSFIQTIGLDMKHFSQVQEIADGYYEEAIRKVLPAENGTDARLDICLPELLKLTHWRYVLWRLLEPYSLNRETFGKLTDLLQRYSENPAGTVDFGGKTFETSGHGRLVIRNKHLIALAR